MQSLELDTDSVRQLQIPLARLSAILNGLTADGTGSPGIKIIQAGSRSVVTESQIDAANGSLVELLRGRVAGL